MISATALIFISLTIAVCATALSVIIFLKLLQIQHKLHDIFGEQGLEKNYSLLYYVDKIAKQKAILELDTASQQIKSAKELTAVLAKIVQSAQKIFGCQFVEVSLIDEETEIYHSACSTGQPVKFRQGGQDFDQVIKSITFSGIRFGTIRLMFDRANAITVADHELLDLLVVQAAIAILNSQYSEKLISMQRQTEESVKAKTGFLANLSHELRGPLGIILNAVELVLEGICGPVEPMQEKTLTMVKKNGDHLLELINDVLDYAKVESGKVNPKPELIDVGLLLHEIIKLVNSQAVKKNHQLSAHTGEEQLAIKVDRRHIRQILINFLTNAIKYTPDNGAVEIRVQKVAGKRIKITVEDNGIGIAEDQKQSVFKAFERIDNEYSRKQIGTGLGLSLTEKLVRENGGKIGFESAPGKGSSFWIVFDAADPAALSQGLSESKRVPVAAGGNRLVLAIEPDESESRILCDYLESVDYRTSSHRSITAEQVKELEPDILVIENSYLDEQAAEFIHRIKDAVAPKNLPVLLLTSRAFDFDTEQYLRRGIDVCVNKPYSLKELAIKIGQVGGIA